MARTSGPDRKGLRHAPPPARPLISFWRDRMRIERIGSYSVTAKIGEGGMGEVYRARDTKLDRDVALKVLTQAFMDDPDRLAASPVRALGTTYAHDVMM